MQQKPRPRDGAFVKAEQRGEAMGRCKAVLMNDQAVMRALKRIAHEIVEHNLSLIHI